MVLVTSTELDEIFQDRAPWAYIPNANGRQFISLATGDVASTASGVLKIIRPWKVPSFGYFMVHTVAGKRYVHHLVCEIAHGARPAGAEVRHLDGDRWNNAATNLAWGSRKQNAQDMVAHGHSCRGIKNVSAKLTPDDIKEIRRLRSDEGLTYDLIGQRYGVGHVTILKIVERRTWGHIP